MRATHVFWLVALLMMSMLTACAGDASEVDVEKLKSQPKQFVGTEVCKTCHLEHFDAWQMTLHSKMAQNVKENRDALIVPIDRERIVSDLKILEAEGKLKKPVDEIYIPTEDEILYTLGSTWKQRFIVEKDGTLYISPVQYNTQTGRWVNYHEHDWQERPWLLKCGGCHVTGVNLEEQTFEEPGITCESCHGKGSWHAALPRTALFQKRETIVNPSKLPRGVAAQICGSCHNRGKSTKQEGAGWPVGYEPGKALEEYYVSTSFEAGDVKHVYANEFSKGHHQQYIDWSMSEHAAESVMCVSCHESHQIGLPGGISQTRASGSQNCYECHTMVNQNMAHAIHSFSNCLGCHMPRIAKSAESGDIHSHVFKALLPQDTLDNPDIPNSCQTCHQHKDADLKELQKQFEALSKLPKPRGPVLEEQVNPYMESGSATATQ